MLHVNVGKVSSAIVPDGATDDDDEQHRQKEGEQNPQNNLLFSGRPPADAPRPARNAPPPEEHGGLGNPSSVRWAAAMCGRDFPHTLLHCLKLNRPDGFPVAGGERQRTGERSDSHRVTSESRQVSDNHSRQLSRSSDFGDVQTRTVHLERRGQGQGSSSRVKVQGVLFAVCA
ncbi:hypothetical protein EYF80_009661 [Liparis tanakae]|uniref:Uncharacterized protein n=1 Tax=Liparis tanakae TaxID=230148 RepID=A0A4Z2IRX8_9TELE|nr:hypothetical protein EYF80_009661 [Liparis tanakae]